MIVEPTILADLAVMDLRVAVRQYATDGGQKIADRFSDAARSAIRHLEQFPASGSLRLSQLLGIPELRSWPVARFPYVILYIKTEVRIEVRRVLHAARDISAVLGEP